MAINYPVSLDTLTNPLGTQTLDSPDHATQHANANDIVEVLEVKVGLSAGTPTVDKVLIGSGNGTSTWTGTWSNATLTSPVINTPTGDVATLTGTQTLSNKRVTPRVVTTTDDATAVIDVDVTDVYELSAVANATTFTLTGTPTDGQKLIVRAKDAGAAKGLTWTGFTVIGVTLPTTTVISKWHIVGCIYNSAATQWQAVAVVAEA